MSPSNSYHHSNQNYQNYQKSTETLFSNDILSTISLYARTIWYFILYPFFVSIYESIAIWRVIPIVRRSKRLRDAVRNCLVLNGVVFIGSLLLYTYILTPIFDIMSTAFNSHLCHNWYFSNFSNFSNFDQNSSIINTINNISTDISTNTIGNGNNSSINDQCGFFFTQNLLALFYHLFWSIPVYITSIVANGLWHGRISDEVLALLQHDYEKAIELQKTPQHSSSPSLYSNTHLHTPNRSNQNFSNSMNNDNSNSNNYNNNNNDSLQSEAKMSPLQMFTRITEQFSRSAIFILLLIQATILSLITFPPLFSIDNVGADVVSGAVGNKMMVSNLFLFYFKHFINYIIQNLPLLLSYALTSISYTYAALEFTWASSNKKVLEMKKKSLFTSTQGVIIAQLSTLRGEDDLTQLNCRFHYVEYRWSYFVGFSLFLTLVTFHLPFLLSISLFGALFPITLLTGLVSVGYLDMLDVGLFPEKKISIDSAKIDKSDDKNINSPKNAPSTPRVTIPPNSTPKQALDIIYSSHRLITPRRFPIFDLARYINDHVFASANKIFIFLKKFFSLEP